MTSIAKLVEQHVAEYESRLKHVDELTQRADDATDQGLDSELQALIKERNRLANHVEQMKLRSLDDWDKEELSMAGPMGVWDAVAQQLEKLVERLDR
jgi:predicted component of type VI protein secretion system